MAWYDFLTDIGNKNKEKTKQAKAYNQQEALKRRGVISPLAEVTSPAPTINLKGIFQGLLGGITPTATGSASISPTAAPTPSPTPMVQNNRVGPLVPQDIPQTYYTNRNQQIEPQLFDAITTASPTGDLALNDYMKRMALGLGTQESSGGYNTSGDNGNSSGPYHISQIYRPEVTKEQAMDPKWATNYVFQEMLRNMKRGSSKEASLKSWNSKSVSPRYDTDIPQMATTSSFYRGK